jgi:hypothetical protein
VKRLIGRPLAERKSTTLSKGQKGMQARSLNTFFDLLGKRLETSVQVSTIWQLFFSEITVIL